MRMLKPGDWIKLMPRSDTAKTRIDAAGNIWMVRQITEDRVLLRSANFAYKNPSRYDGMWIWKEHDPNYEWY